MIELAQSMKFAAEGNRTTDLMPDEVAAIKDVERFVELLKAGKTTFTKVYTIEEYHNIKCEKQHQVGIAKDGKPITQQCGQPIRCSRTIREITTSRQRAIEATKDKPNFAYQEFDLVGAK